MCLCLLCSVDVTREAAPVRLSVSSRLGFMPLRWRLPLFVCVFRLSHTERDVSMKRQLVEDLKTRLTFLQEMEKSYRGQVEELEKKVHVADRRCIEFF